MLVGVVDVQYVDALDAHPGHALLDRAHDAVVREVKDGIERRRARKGVALRRCARTEQAADLGCKHVLVAWPGAEHRTQPLLRQAVSILRRGVKKANPGGPCGLDHTVRLVIRQSLEQASQWSRPKAQARYLERRSPELDPLGRIQSDAPVATCLRSHRSPLAMCAVAAARASSGSPSMIAS